MKKRIPPEIAKRLTPTPGPLPTPCQVWKGKLSNGYGVMWRDGAWRLVHRIVYSEVTGETLTPDIQVRHRCDNPCCAAFDHLKKGTHRDNMRDRDERGRTLRGEDHANAKLTTSDVIEMRLARLDFGKSYRDLAKDFGISHTQAQHICNGRAWQHV